jgi:preprotein translocase subunit SecF
MFKIIQKRKIWFTLSTTLVALSVIALALWGLNPGIDFTGGSILELEFKTARPGNQQIQQAVDDLGIAGAYIQPTGELGLIIRTISLSEEEHQQLLEKIEQIQNPEYKMYQAKKVTAESLGLTGEGTENLDISIVDELNQIPDQFKEKIPYQSFEEQKFDSIGPIIGAELKQKAVYAIIIVLLAIIAYIAYAFRKVSKPVESWKFGAAAIIALIHDIAIIIGVFAVIGHFLNVQIDSYFVTALLTILGFSVHDTIVTFDRTRENLKRHQDKTFEEVVNLSVNETIIRSLNTSLTTVFVLLAIFLFGGETIKYFVLALILGVIVGTYSSIFLASPLLMIWYKMKKY